MGNPRVIYSSVQKYHLPQTIYPLKMCFFVCLVSWFVLFSYHIRRDFPKIVHLISRSPSAYSFSLNMNLPFSLRKLLFFSSWKARPGIVVLFFCGPLWLPWSFFSQRVQSQNFCCIFLLPRLQTVKREYFFSYERGWESTELKSSARGLLVSCFLFFGMKDQLIFAIAWRNLLFFWHFRTECNFR